MIRKMCFFGPKKIRFMRIESVLQTKNRSEPAKNRFSVALVPGQGLTTPWGQNFDVNRNILSLRSFVASFKKISLKSDFIHFFFMILYMYIVPGQGLTTPWGQNFDVNRTVLSLHSFVTSFKKMSLKPDFIQFSS